MNPKTIKFLLAIIVTFSAGLAFAADTITVPVLTIGGETYTNVEFGTVSGSRVTMFFDGGGKQIAMSNLPPDFQKRLHYDPESARSEDAAEARRKAEIKQRLEEQSVQVTKAKSTLGPPQTIHLVRLMPDGYIQITLPNGLPAEVYIHDLPNEVSDFIRDLTQTAAAVQNDLHTVYNDNGHSKNGVFTRQAQQAENIQHLRDLKGRIGALGVVIASPSGYLVRRNVRQWEFHGMASADVMP